MNQPVNDAGPITRINYGPAGILAALTAMDTSQTPILAEALAAHQENRDDGAPEP